MKPDRDMEKTYSIPEFVTKLRRLADALEADESFEIQIAGERVFVPARAVVSIEHEREDGHEEIEFQLSWDALDSEEDEDEHESEDAEASS